MSLRVACVAAGEVFGGAERQILTLVAEASVSRDVRFTCLLFSDGHLAAALRESGVEVRIASDIGSAIRAIRSLAGITDVMHVHGYKASILAAAALRLDGSRLVKTVHGAPEFGQVTPVRSLLMRSYRFLEAILDRSSGMTRVFVTAELRSRFGTPRIRDIVIHNGLDPDAEQGTPPFAHSGTGDVLRVAVIGRLEYVKGVDLALQAMSRLPRGEFRLTVVGDGPERLNLERQRDSLSLESLVTFTGFLQDPAALLADADVLLISSRHEGLPYVLLEAMRGRVPVIATAVGGLREILTPDVNAILVVPGDANAIAGALSAARGDRPRLRRLAERANDALRTHFTSRTMYEAYVGVYRRLAAEAS